MASNPFQIKLNAAICFFTILLTQKLAFCHETWRIEAYTGGLELTGTDPLTKATAVLRSNTDNYAAFYWTPTLRKTWNLIVKAGVRRSTFLAPPDASLINLQQNSLDIALGIGKDLSSRWYVSLLANYAQFNVISSGDINAVLFQSYNFPFLSAISEYTLFTIGKVSAEVAGEGEVILPVGAPGYNVGGGVGARAGIGIRSDQLVLEPVIFIRARYINSNLINQQYTEDGVLLRFSIRLAPKSRPCCSALD